MVRLRTASGRLLRVRQASAAHLCLSRTAARDLETQGIITRTAGITRTVGLEACRLSYIRLRARRSTLGRGLLASEGRLRGGLVAGPQVKAVA